MPPMAMSSDIRYLPLGRTSASTGTRRPTRSDDHRHGILERVEGQDVGRLYVLFNQFYDCLSGAEAVVQLAVRHSFLGRTVCEAEPKGFDGRGHGVRRVHAAAGPRPRYRGALDLQQLLLVDLAGRQGPDRFENGHHVPALGSGPDGPAVDEHRGPVKPCHGHCAGRHILVAAAYRDQSVEALCRCHRLDGIGNDLAGHEGVAHPLRAHGYAVGDRDRVEHHALATGRIRALGSLLGEPVEMHVAGRDHAPGRRDADLRLMKIVLGESDSPKHCAARRMLGAIDNDTRVASQLFFFHLCCRFV